MSFLQYRYLPNSFMILALIHKFHIILIYLFIYLHLMLSNPYRLLGTTEMATIKASFQTQALSS